jgi:cell division protein FtsB
MSDYEKLLVACVEYRAKLDKLEAENAALINVLEKLAQGKNVPGVTVADVCDYAQNAVDASRKEAQP